MAPPWFTRAIAAAQVVAAAALAGGVVSFKPPGILGVVAGLSVLCFALLAVLSAVWLWRGERRGHWTSLIFQLLVVLGLVTAPVTTTLISVYGSACELLSMPVGAQFYIGAAECLLSSQRTSQVIELAINVWFLLAAGYLWSLIKARGTESAA